MRRVIADCERNPLVQDDPKGNAAFIPFGSGSRACVGQRFAILAIANVFASLLPLYEVSWHFSRFQLSFGCLIGQNFFLVMQNEYLLL